MFGNLGVGRGHPARFDWHAQVATDDPGQGLAQPFDWDFARENLDALMPSSPGASPCCRSSPDPSPARLRGGLSATGGAAAEAAWLAQPGGQFGGLDLQHQRELVTHAGGVGAAVGQAR